MPEQVEVAKVADVPPGTVTLVDVDGEQIALVNADGQFFAVGNECPHLGGSLAEGTVVERNGKPAIECPLHRSVFALETGKMLRPPASRGVESYQVAVEGDAIMIVFD